MAGYNNTYVLENAVVYIYSIGRDKEKAVQRICAIDDSNLSPGDESQIPRTRREELVYLSLNPLMKIPVRCPRDVRVIDVCCARGGFAASNWLFSEIRVTTTSFEVLQLFRSFRMFPNSHMIPLSISHTTRVTQTTNIVLKTRSPLLLPGCVRRYYPTQCELFVLFLVQA